MTEGENFPDEKDEPAECEQEERETSMIEDEPVELDDSEVHI